MLRTSLTTLRALPRGIRAPGSVLCPRNFSPAAPLNRSPCPRSFSSSPSCVSFRPLTTVRRFEAETSRLLDLVAHRLYTDSDTFLRELVSNASDALEKERLRRQQGGGHDLPLEINIDLDADAGKLTIADNGVGMTEEELDANLGTIALSGSQKVRDAGQGEDIIGSFGVGFYSCFMVSQSVEVYTGGNIWRSDTTSGYTITRDPDAESAGKPGTRIVLTLNDESRKRLSSKQSISTIVAKHSSFVAFPIKVNGEVANTQTPLWRENPSEVTEAQHAALYRHVSRAHDSPMVTCHVSTDSPIDVKAVLYVPSMHTERMGSQRMRPGVSLYARRVLIDASPEGLLPEWMRFVKGVAESEDAPLHVSRASLGDNALIAKIGSILAGRLTRKFAETARHNEALHLEFWREYANFIKEGVLTDEDARRKKDLAKLLRYESTKAEPGELVPLPGKDAVETEDGEEKPPIYYLVVTSRAIAETSPYLEPFKARGIEVLLMYSPIDEFVMTGLVEFDGRKLISAEKGPSGQAGEKKEKKKGDDDKDASDKAADGSEDDAKADPRTEAAVAFVRSSLEGVASEVTSTTDLTSTPAIIVDPDTAMFRMRKIMAMNEGSDGSSKTHVPPTPPQRLALNAKHPLILSLGDLSTSDPEKARRIARQMYDNAICAAGLMDDPREMLTRINEILLDAAAASKGE